MDEKAGELCAVPHYLVSKPICTYTLTHTFFFTI